MGEIAINPIHNVHKKYREMNFVNPYIFAPPVDLSTNTEIGGVASTISTPDLLATKLGINVSRITNFSTVGSDIKCRITGSYAMPANRWEGNNNITYYKDLDNLVIELQSGAMRSNNNLPTIEFNGVITCGTFQTSYGYINNVILSNCTTIATQAFWDSYSSLNQATKRMYYIPRCINLGATVGDDGVFTQNSRNLANTIIYANPILQTNNGGMVDGDIAKAISLGATVRYVTNFTAPNPITDLSAGTIYNTAIQLNFTPPSSTNAIDYYELYINDVLQTKKILTSGEYIIGLTPSTSYNFTLIAVDIFYNKSVASNILSVSTTNRSAVDADAIAYITASSNTTYQDIIDDMFVSLKSNSLYTKLQAFYPFLGTTAGQHKWNGKNPLDTDVAFRIIFSGTATFSNLGYAPNGANGYANSKFVPSANQNVNSNGITMVIGTNNTPTSNDVWDIGAYNGGSQCSFFVTKRGNARNTIEGGFNSYNINALANTNSKGIYSAQRTTSTVSKVLKNSSVLQTYSATGTLPTYPIFIGCFNYIGSPITFSNQRFQFTAFHEGLSDAEVATLHTIIDIFETALGRKTW